MLRVYTQAVTFLENSDFTLFSNKYSIYKCLANTESMRKLGKLVTLVMLVSLRRMLSFMVGRKGLAGEQHVVAWMGFLLQWLPSPRLGFRDRVRNIYKTSVE